MNLIKQPRVVFMEFNVFSDHFHLVISELFDNSFWKFPCYNCFSHNTCRRYRTTVRTLNGSPWNQHGKIQSLFRRTRRTRSVLFERMGTRQSLSSVDQRLVDELDLPSITDVYSARGGEAYHPALLLKLWFYG